MSQPPANTTSGLMAAVGAYLIWGLVLPVYMKALSSASALEIVAHRVVWALPFAFLLLFFSRRLFAVRLLLSLRMLALAALSASVISANWGVYVYAIGAGHVLDAALGYYINPLVSLALGVVVLGERPRPLQWCAIALAVVGVAILTIQSGGLPWISLVLACSFGVYGLLRKIVPFGAAEGFFLEVAILFPIAAGILVFVGASGTAHFLDSWQETAMFVILGPLTAIPLILYAMGARQLTLATIGLLQYMVPTLLVLTAVFLFGEPFGRTQLVSFAFIWTALALYTATLFSGRRKSRT